MNGAGPLVVLVPSLGRGKSDYEMLASALAASGFRAVSVDPRGVADSTGPLEDITLHDLAEDVAAVIEQFGGPAHVVGHAFGNRVARCVAADRPDLVATVTLLAAGGIVPPAAADAERLARVLDVSLPAAERASAIRESLFASTSDPTPWTDGWHPTAARAQHRATVATPVADWWTAGTSAPVLVIQGLDDRVAPPENGRRLRDEIPHRVRLVELADAGHALLPERPDTVSETLIAFLTDNDPRRRGA